MLLLQHPLEQHHAKGTARLLALSLRRCRIWVGEVFDPQQLAQALAAPEPGQTTCLLYPENPGEPPGQHSGPADTADTAGTCGRLVLLDASWRKSRKMLLLNPLLQQLPRLALQDLPASRYTIRKAHLEHQLSTLEAGVLALQQLEGPAPAHQDLLAGFDGFVEQQALRFQL